MGSILIVDESPAAESMQVVLGERSHHCVAVHDREAAETALKERPIDLLIEKIHDKTEDFKIFDLAKKIRPACEGIAILPNSLEEYFPELLTRDFPHNFAADNHPVNPLELVATAEKLLNRDIFGLSKYEIQPEATLELASSKEKYPSIERVRDFFLGHGVSERIVRNIELILNELLMNAIFDAPVAADGNRPYSNTDRSESFEIQAGKRPSLSYGISPDYLAVSVSDPYGSLSKKTFFSYLNRCFSERSVLETVGKGAGMGLFLIFKSLDQMVINVAAGKKTEVIALLDHRASLGELKRRHHSFHFFDIDQSKTGKEKSP